MKKKKLLFVMLVAMFTILFAPTSVSAQQRNMTIVTNHPDFSLKVKRCAASGNTVIVDIILNNQGTNDVDIAFDYNLAEAIDDQGNTYRIEYKFANATSYVGSSYGKKLVSEIPTKLSVKIEGVPADVENIARLQLDVRCEAWGLKYEANKPVIIRNIPITRQ